MNDFSGEFHICEGPVINLSLLSFSISNGIFFSVDNSCSTIVWGYITSFKYTCYRMWMNPIWIWWRSGNLGLEWMQRPDGILFVSLGKADWVHLIYGNNWNVLQKSRLDKCSNNTFSFLPIHIIGLFFQYPLGRAMWLNNGVPNIIQVPNLPRDPPFSFFPGLLDR